MSSRFSLAEERDYLTGRLGVSAIALANYRPRYNIAPQQEHFIVTTEYERRKLTSAKWGLVTNPDQQGRRKYLINAKAETVESRPTFAEAFAQRRCVIPASGFYEWTGPSSAAAAVLDSSTRRRSAAVGWSLSGRGKERPGYSISGVHHPDLCSKLNPRHDPLSDARHLIRPGRR